jgi:hypothetical protein
MSNASENSLHKHGVKEFPDGQHGERKGGLRGQDLDVDVEPEDHPDVAEPVQPVQRVGLNLPRVQLQAGPRVRGQRALAVAQP